MENKLQIERDAKNRAYAFILSMGLFNEFAQFCTQSQNTDAHAQCLSMLP